MNSTRASGVPESWLALAGACCSAGLRVSMASEFDVEPQIQRGSAVSYPAGGDEVYPAGRNRADAFGGDGARRFGEHAAVHERYGLCELFGRHIVEQHGV